jgi:hypothetical protein
VKRLVAILSSSTLICAMSIVPVFADTGTTSNTSSFQHAADCFALLFTDPAKHATECGGPTFTPAAAPNAGGDGNACTTGEIVPFDITGTPMKSDADMLVAQSDPCCPRSELTVPQQQLSPLFDTLWSTDKAWLVTATADTCQL